MSAADSGTVSPVPEHLRTVTPRLVVSDGAAAIAFEIAQVFRQAHQVRPAGPGKSWRRPDVADAGRPCGVVSGIVLGPERF
jgi:hypothetical protein